MSDRTLKIGPTTLRGCGTVRGWRQRIEAAWVVLVHGRIDFAIHADDLTLVVPEDRDNGG